jgi:hypothetical protein
VGVQLENFQEVRQVLLVICGAEDDAAGNVAADFG